MVVQQHWNVINKLTKFAGGVTSKVSPGMHAEDVRVFGSA